VLSSTSGAGHSATATSGGRGPECNRGERTAVLHPFEKHVLIEDEHVVNAGVSLPHSSQ
jgi:hypothetical protein